MLPDLLVNLACILFGVAAGLTVAELRVGSCE